MKNRKVFILYQYEQFTNDYKQVMEYYSIKDLLKDNKQIKLKNNRSIYHSITNSIDNIKL